MTDRRYNLLCKVKAFKKPIREDIGPKVLEYESQIACLIPDRNDECMRFFQAWLPDDERENVEAGATADIPVAPFTRVAIKPGEDAHSVLGGFEGPYLQVMNTRLAKWLAEKKNGEYVRITILPEGDEEMLDEGMDDNEGGYEVVHSQRNFKSQL